MLTARDLSFGYPTGPAIVDRWNADFLSGEMVAITAESGRGKSTLLYVLGLMLRPEAGRVELSGQCVSDLPDHARASLRATEFGFVFQDSALDANRSVLDNVLEPALYAHRPNVDSRRRAHDLLEKFGVLGKVKSKPGQVSGGQSQRIALCRALLNSPKVILADEPTGNLDPITAELVMDAFREESDGGASVIIVTHDPTVVSQCDRVIEL